MNKRLKRYITKCIILFMMPAIVILAGCGNEAQVDSSGIVENVGLIDTSKCIEPPFVCLKEEILEKLTN